MERPLTAPMDIEALRRIIARSLLHGAANVAERLGDVELREHQRVAAARVLALMRERGGALLAEPAGVGKTYVALAVARTFPRSIVIAPASLRTMWLASAASAGVSFTMASHEALSRSAPHIEPPPDANTLVIVDEAHRFRNADTQRFCRLRELCRDGRVLLVSATPVQNGIRDLATPLALFLGSEAFDLDAAALARYVVRAPSDSTDPRLPLLVGPTTVPIEVNASTLARIEALPPPLPARDEGLASALMTEMLLRRWASSHAALVQSLRRVLARAGGLRDAAIAGRRLERSDLALWQQAEDSVQLAFPTLSGADLDASDAPAALLVETLDAYIAAAGALLRDLLKEPDADAHRAAALLALRRNHAGQRLIAFSQYARTVEALFRLTRDTGRIAALTAAGARIASGSIPRAEVIGQFAPGRAAQPAATRIDLLITTDLLSEGLNLQEASVIVHLDLPWNPARLDQRVGRARRLGSLHQTVTVYSFDPSGARRAMERIETRLAEKLRAAREIVGVPDRLLPAERLREPPAKHASAAESLGEVHATLLRWSGSGHEQDTFDESGPAGAFASASSCGAVVYAGVRSQVPGWLCLYRAGSECRLVARVGERISAETEHLASALAVADGDGAVVPAELVTSSVDAARAWLDLQRAPRAVGLRAALASRARRDLLVRVAQIVAAAPRHLRPSIASLADRARAAGTVPLSAGAEEMLHRLVRAPMAPETWLREVATFGAANARTLSVNDDVDAEARVLALIVFSE